MFAHDLREIMPLHIPDIFRSQLHNPCLALNPPLSSFLQCCSQDQRVGEASAYLQGARIHHQPLEGTNAHDDGIREEAKGGERMPLDNFFLFYCFLLLT